VAPPCASDLRTSRRDGRGCRNDIAASAFHATAIASIAREWGFTDPSSFTRMFKNAYGMSPREWRHQANTRRSELAGEFTNQ
jgi:AraC-like DNA-binding protein